MTTKNGEPNSARALLLTIGSSERQGMTSAGKSINKLQFGVKKK